MFVSPCGMLSVILKQSETRHLRCQSVPKRGESQSATDKGWYCASLQQSYYASLSPAPVPAARCLSPFQAIREYATAKWILCLRHQSHCSRSWYYLIEQSSKRYSHVAFRYIYGYIDSNISSSRLLMFIDRPRIFVSSLVIQLVSRTTPVDVLDYK